jgi:hypothetical protein
MYFSASVMVITLVSLVVTSSHRLKRGYVVFSTGSTGGYSHSSPSGLQNPDKYL